MKKFLIILSILLLGGVGYFTYFQWEKQANLTNWSFVPQNALAVYESSDPIATLDGISSTAVWQNLSSLPLFEQLTKQLDVLDTISIDGNFKSLFKNTNTIVSLHQKSSDSFDFLFVAAIDNLSKHAFVSLALVHFRDLGYPKKTREYLDFTISEISIPGSSDIFTYIFYKNYFIGSFSAFLVEDAIRTVSNDENISFQNKFAELQNISKLLKDEGNLYFNLSNWEALFGGVLKENQPFPVAKSAFLDLKINEKSLNLTGFTFVNEPTEFLTTVIQKPGDNFDMAEIIPNQSAWVYHYNLSDQEKFASKLESYFLISDNDVLKKRQDLVAKHDFDVTYLFQLLDDEIGIVTLEPYRLTHKDKLLILEIQDMGEALKFINSVSEREASKVEDTVYVEQFGDFEIRKLPIADFPYSLLGEIADGFESAFYLQYRNYLVFSNNLLQLKNLTLAIENENTWSKSLNIKRFLDQSNKSANFSLFINTPRAWLQTTAKLKPSWEEIAKENQFSLRNFEFITAQFSAVDNKFYTNITAHQPNPIGNNIPDKVKTIASIALPDFIITKPYLITNHNTKAKEVFIQDSSYHVHQFTNNLKNLWSQDIGEPIVSQINQMDYYKNGRLQVAFATQKKIHLIDRNGDYIAGFPKTIPSGFDIEHFSIIDYDNSKNYRFAIVDIKGNVFLTDKNVKALQGWSPKAFDSPLVQSPQHYRIGRKDIIITIQTNGQINVLNRRGEPMSGFPLKLEKDIKSEIFVKESNELASSSIHVITEDGENIEISLTGKLINREQLYKPSAQSSFQLINDVSNESFMIMRRTERKYEILSETGQLLFEKDYFSRKQLYPQYYKLGGGINYMIFVDSGGAFLYIYDMTGRLVTGRPLTATMPISLLKRENTYQIYRVVDKNLENISLAF